MAQAHGAVDEVLRETRAVAGAAHGFPGGAGVPVTPVLCIHRAELPFWRPTVGGVRIFSGRGLARHIAGQRDVLDPATVRALADHLAAALPSAGRPARPVVLGAKEPA